MTDDFDPEFKNLLRKLITDRLAKEIAAGRSWREARQKMQDVFDVDEAALLKQAARMIELDRDSIEREFDRDLADLNDAGVIDLATAREQRIGDKTKKSQDKRKQETGAYGRGVRDQVFEVVVRQGLSGAPWRSICAGPLAINNIDPADVQKEIDRRKTSMPQSNSHTTGDGDDDADDLASAAGRDGSAKAPAGIPKKAFPFFGGAGLALGLPGKKNDKNSPSKKMTGKSAKAKQGGDDQKNKKPDP